jgi:putative ABC transport system permease protein
MRDLALVLRGMWFRRWLSLAVLVLATLVVAGAVTGPLFLRAAGESVLRDSLDEALPIGRSVVDRTRTPVDQHPLDAVERTSAARLSEVATLDRLLGPPVTALEVRAIAGRRGMTGNPAPLVYRQGVCAHLKIVDGACVATTGAVVVSASAAASQQWSVGAPLDVNGRRLTVVGTYEPLDPLGDYWGGHPYFAAFSGSGVAGDLGNTLDALFATRATLDAQPGHIVATGSVDRVLDVDRIRLTDVPALTAELLQYAAAGGRLTPVYDDVTNTAIVPVLEQAMQIRDKLLAPTVIVMAQLLLLCWLVLFLVTANAAEARGPEVALAKLRGVPAMTTVAFGLLDTLLLVVLAVPLGLGLGVLGVTVLTRAHLALGTPVVVTGGVYLAAAGAGAGAAVAAVLAGSRTLRRPVVDQWRRASRRADSRPWIVDVTVAGAAAAALAGLVQGGVIGSGDTDVFALVAPGLVVLAAALAGSRILPAICRAAYGPTRRHGAMGRFLAVRQLARRPSTLRLALVLAVAFGLVSFGADAWSVASDNAHDRAWTEIGAAEVLTVSTPRGQDLDSLVEQLDPSGREATAVTESTDYAGARPITLLAVQPDRFARIAFWRSDFGPPLDSLTPRLNAAAVPAVPLSGDTIEVSVAGATLSAPGTLVLVADIAQVGAGRTSVDLGPVRDGIETLAGPLPCAWQQCQLIGLHLARTGTSGFPVSGRLLVTGIRTKAPTGWATVDAHLTDSGGWRPVAGGATAAMPATGASTAPAGLTLETTSDAFENPAWQVADRPASLPALMTSDLGQLDHLQGLDGSTVPVHAVATGPALPGAGSRTVVVDRAYALEAADDHPAVAAQRIWLSSGASATFRERLEAAGVTVLSTQSAAERTAVYSRQGPALAILLFLVGAALGAILAVGGAVLNLHLAGRRRTYEIAAMTAIGVRRATLRTSLYAEQGLLLGFGVAVGIAAGVVGAVLALPSVPQFADDPAQPPLLFGLHAVPVLLVVLAAVAALAPAVALSSAALLRTTRFDQLREAPA